MEEKIQNYFDILSKKLDDIDKKEITKIIDILYTAWVHKKQVFILGNGGSAATASHFACDLGKGTLNNFYDQNRKRFRVISLTDNVSTITAFSNDLEYEDVFAQQLNNLIEEGDVVIGISASGNSKNIIKAIELAKNSNAITIGFLGFDGGKLKNLVDYSLIYHENHFGRSEDAHLILEHLICGLLYEKINEE